TLMRATADTVRLRGGEHALSITAAGNHILVPVSMLRDFLENELRGALIELSDLAGLDLADDNTEEQPCRMIRGSARSRRAFMSRAKRSRTSTPASPRPRNSSRNGWRRSPMGKRPAVRVTTKHRSGTLR